MACGPGATRACRVDRVASSSGNRGRDEGRKCSLRCRSTGSPERVLLRRSPGRPLPVTAPADFSGREALPATLARRAVGRGRDARALLCSPGHVSANSWSFGLLVSAHDTRSLLTRWASREQNGRGGPLSPPSGTQGHASKLGRWGQGREHPTADRKRHFVEPSWPSGMHTPLVLTRLPGASPIPPAPPWASCRGHLPAAGGAPRCPSPRPPPPGGAGGPPWAHRGLLLLAAGDLAPCPSLPRSRNAP